jgi:hypothetical protein
MRVRVRSIEPPADDAGLEELVVEEAPPADAPRDGDASPTDRPHGAAARGGAAGLPALAVHLETHRRPVTAKDLGPNGDVVLDLLSRASQLTPAERRALEKEAAWRWWMVTPLTGSTMPAVRARALLLGRADGRSDAIVALEAAVAEIVTRVAGPKAGRSRLPACILNAGLAVLVRDLVEPEVFETLFSPWREVMHH